MTIDPIGTILAKTTFFPGRKYLIDLWSQSLSSKSKRVAKLPNGYRLEADLNIPYERMIFLRKEEYAELLYLASLLGKGDVFVDVGSNVGIWSLSASKAVGPTGHVFSFEPNPVTYAKLLKNLKRNSITNVTPGRSAVSCRSGKSLFYCHPEHNISSMIRYSDGITNGEIEVSTVSLDDVLCGQKAPIKGIKIDTEGHERETLLGARSTIQKHKPWLIIEFNTNSLESKCLKDWPVHQDLLLLGYTAFRYTDWVGSRFYPYRRLVLIPETQIHDLTVTDYQNIIYRPTQSL